MSLASSIFLICSIPYFMLAYTFFLIPYTAYMFRKHPYQEKVMQTLAFLLAPFLIPFGGVLLVGWGIAGIIGGLLVVILFSIISWLAWLNRLFPFGRVFKAWFNAAYWVLIKIRKFLSMIGVKRILFGVPLSRFGRFQQI